jgi:hypothetical protein
MMVKKAKRIKTHKTIFYGELINISLRNTATLGQITRPIRKSLRNNIILWFINNLILFNILYILFIIKVSLEINVFKRSRSINTICRCLHIRPFYFF